MDKSSRCKKGKSRGRFQFSIRSLMLLTLAVAIVSAFVGGEIRRRRDQYLMGLDLENMEAIVQFEPAPKWVAFLVGEDYCPKVTGVELDSVPVSSKHFSLIAELDDLTTLLLFYTETGDEELRQLSGLRKLRRLYLTGTNVTDDGVIHLLKIDSLDVLTLNETSIGDKALSDLRRLPNLTCLEVDDTKITDAGLKYLPTFPRLEAVYLANTRTSPEAIADLNRECPDLVVGSAD